MNGSVANAGTMPGSVGEIGVHHGKLFLLAYLASRRDEAAFAVDVFE
ncbi:MAG TPA: hypothetical protein VGR26_05515 [Acidimicrobiales bacterium]|nr:hypothetical protein [Acidimicrobiales bacterium]